MTLEPLKELEPTKRRRRAKVEPTPEPLPPVSKPETIEENKYAPTPKIGSEKPISRPGAKVTRVGLGGLKTTTN